MKNFKKVTAAIAATLMAATMVAPMAMNFSVSAADTTITVEESANRTFKAYKLMSAVVSDDNKNITYTVNPTYSSVLQECLGVNTDAAVIVALEGYSSSANLESDMRVFADAMYAKVKDMPADVAEFKNGVAEVDYGYYLVVDTTEGLENDVRSKVMVDTADKTTDGVVIQLKKNKPTFEKKIWDTNDTETTPVTFGNEAGQTALNTLTGWQDSADHDMGDKVPFKLTATLPSDINLYDDYSIAFHDTLDANVWEFDADSVKVYMGENDVTELFTLLDVPANGDTFTLVDITDNIKDNGWTLAGGDKIDVYYTATLTTDAVVGNPGNWNKANLEYTNDYYWESDGNYGNGEDEKDKTKTPDDWVVAFTYKTVIDKIDAEFADLNGATFSLWKKVAGTTENEGWVKLETIEGTSASQFTFTGIDDGQYKIVEDVAPAGYSKANDIEFTVIATHEETVETKVENGILKELTCDNINLTASLTSAEITRKANTTHNAASGEIYTEVVNKSGSTLPSTGGMGTTLFYLGGGAMVAVAGIFLITKKRMNKDEA